MRDLSRVGGVSVSFPAGGADRSLWFPSLLVPLSLGIQTLTRAHAVQTTMMTSDSGKKESTCDSFWQNNINM